jgi:hypothetical protein
MLLCLVFVFVAGRAAADTAFKEYGGPDGGWIVFSETNPDVPNKTRALIRIRVVGGRGQFIASGPTLTTGPIPPDASAPAFDSQTRAQTRASVERDGLQLWDMPNSTVVFVFREPPGEYEIYEVDVSYIGSTACVNALEKGHVIHVTVTAGKTTYVGAFNATPLKRPQTWLGGYVPAWLLILNDQSARDLPIARRKAPDLSSEIAARSPSDDFATAAFR